MNNLVHGMQSNLLLGALKITEAARLVLKHQPYDLLGRHAVNEHGLFTQADARENERNMRTLGSIISRYRSDPINMGSPLVTVLTREVWSETIIVVDSAR